MKLCCVYKMPYDHTGPYTCQDCGDVTNPSYSERRLALRQERLRELGPEPARWRLLARRRWRARRREIMAMDVSWVSELYERIYDAGHMKALAEGKNPALCLIRKETKR